MQETFKKIIEKLEEKSIFMTTCDGYGANCVPVGTIEEIVKQEAEKFGTDTNVGSNGWIPVAERLPEDGTYLTTLDGELVGQEEPFTGMCGIENGKWDEDGCVIAWMSKDLLWKPSIHMPKEAARIWIKVTDVRVERLKEINGDDALAEGVDKYIHANGMLNEDQTITSFIGIWNSTIKKSDLDRYGWDANPWVWAIEFEWCEKPAD